MAFPDLLSTCWVQNRAKFPNSGTCDSNFYFFVLYAEIMNRVAKHVACMKTCISYISNSLFSFKVSVHGKIMLSVLNVINNIDNPHTTMPWSTH